MWPIISLSCLTGCAIVRGIQLRNCVLRFWNKISSAHGSSNVSIWNRNLGFLRDQICSIFHPASDSDLEEGVNENQHHETEPGALFTLQRSVYCTSSQILLSRPHSNVASTTIFLGSSASSNWWYLWLMSRTTCWIVTWMTISRDPRLTLAGL